MWSAVKRFINWFWPKRPVVTELTFNKGIPVSRDSVIVVSSHNYQDDHETSPSGFVALLVNAVSNPKTISQSTIADEVNSFSRDLPRITRVIVNGKELSRDKRDTTSKSKAFLSDISNSISRNSGVSIPSETIKKGLSLCHQEIANSIVMKFLSPGGVRVNGQQAVFVEHVPSSEVPNDISNLKYSEFKVNGAKVTVNYTLPMQVIVPNLDPKTVIIRVSAQLDFSKSPQSCEFCIHSTELDSQDPSISLTFHGKMEFLQTRNKPRQKNKDTTKSKETSPVAFQPMYMEQSLVSSNKSKMAKLCQCIPIFRRKTPTSNRA